jgi:hypothetical protein
VIALVALVVVVAWLIALAEALRWLARVVVELLVPAPEPRARRRPR